MKTLSFIIGVLCMYGFLNAQNNINETISVQQAKKIELQFEHGDISLSTWEGNSIQITGKVSINDGLNDDAFKINSAFKDGGLTVNGFIENMDKLPRTITVMKDGQKYVFMNEGGDRSAVRKKIKETLGGDKYDMYSVGVSTEIELEIKIPVSLPIDVRLKFGDLIINNVTSPLSVNNTHGYIEAFFLDLNKIKEVELNSIHDFVDITVPANTSLSVDLDSDFGRIYTDLDLKVDTNRSETKGFAYRIVGNINNGGPLIKARAKHENIYLRKAM